MPEACPKCGHENIIKHGFILQKQRYKSKSCNYQYAYGTAQPITTTNREHGKPKWMKVMTILLYVSGLSMNAIAQLFNVSAQAVLNWVCVSFQN